MKKLLVLLLFFIVAPVSAMKTEEKIIMGTLATAFAGYVIHEFFIKDPVVREKEKEERNRKEGEINVILGNEYLSRQASKASSTK